MTSALLPKNSLLPATFISFLYCSCAALGHWHLALTRTVPPLVLPAHICAKLAGRSPSSTLLPQISVGGVRICLLCTLLSLSLLACILSPASSRLSSTSATRSASDAPSCLSVSVIPLSFSFASSDSEYSSDSMLSTSSLSSSSRQLAVSRKTSSPFLRKLGCSHSRHRSSSVTITFRLARTLRVHTPPAPLLTTRSSDLH